MLHFNGTKVAFVKYYIIIPLVKQAGIRETVRISKKYLFLAGEKMGGNAKTNFLNTTF